MAGVNPLATLYATLSEGLHARSDEDCIELAFTIREVLEGLLTQIDANKKAVKAITNGTKRLLAEKTPNAK